MKPVALIIMDGMALSSKLAGNAFATAPTPNLDYLFANHPHIQLKAHGHAVGLPSDDDIGNSEVGHNALGSGQIIPQGAKLVNQAIESGQIFTSDVWIGLVNNVVANHTTMHFLGLLSDGNVHANINHLIALVGQAKKDDVAKVRIHILLDGRDVEAQSALDYVEKLSIALDSFNCDSFDAYIASGGGRQVITMDRYGADWSVVEKGWQTHVLGLGEGFASAKDAIESARKVNPNIIDQDITPFVIVKDNQPIGKITNGDSVVFFNFRGDRAIEMSLAFEADEFDKFDRGSRLDVMFAGMLQYDGDNAMPKNYLVSPPKIDNVLTHTLAEHDISQFAISETQKYGHITYFWNGNRSEKVDAKLEDWVEITSDLIPFEERPWMKAAEITDEVIAAIKSHKYGFIRANYPNGDMVGHTGDFHATQIAVATVDLAIGRLMKAAKDEGVTLIITADHGNAEEMFEKDGKTPKTAHTLNPVPFIVFDEGLDIRLKNGDFSITNVAATVAELLGVEPHPSWEESLID